jgi:hypothetical protein
LLFVHWQDAYRCRWRFHSSVDRMLIERRKRNANCILVDSFHHLPQQRFSGCHCYRHVDRRHLAGLDLPMDGILFDSTVGSYRRNVESRWESRRSYRWNSTSGRSFASWNKRLRVEDAGSLGFSWMNGSWIQLNDLFFCIFGIFSSSSGYPKIFASIRK